MPKVGTEEKAAVNDNSPGAVPNESPQVYQEVDRMIGSAPEAGLLPVLPNAGRLRQ